MTSDRQEEEPRQALLDARHGDLGELPPPPPPTVALLAARYLMADRLATLDRSERREKKERVAARLAEELDRLAPGEHGPVELVAAYVRSLPPRELIGFFVELHFTDPFAPYVLKTRRRDHRNALRSLLDVTGQDPALSDRIGETASSASAAYKQVNWLKIGLIGAGSAAALGIGGLLAAPIIGTALGGAAGLTGAAATSYGLALLGGGALAAGGAGMAGGMWLVAGAGAIAGAAAAGGGTALFQIGAAQARIELIKLQVTYKLAIVDEQVGQIKAQDVLTSLHGELDEMRRTLEEERRLNDDNAARVKDLEATVDAFESALEWMRRQETLPA